MFICTHIRSQNDAEIPQDSFTFEIFFPQFFVETNLLLSSSLEHKMSQSTSNADVQK